MRKIIIFILSALFLCVSMETFAKKRYGEILCKESSNYKCYKVRKGDTWEKLFPNPDDADVVKRLNRTNLNLRAGWIIAIPKNIGRITHFDISPFELKRKSTGQRTIIVDLNKLAWSAYDEKGNLIHWGPASGGRGWCDDVNRPCRTQTGNYTIYRKQGYDCISSKFPLPYGGAAMPYCMHYYGAYALHGSFEVPGFNDSHGCIRLFITDARWLNYQFVNYNTKVIVKTYE